MTFDEFDPRCEKRTQYCAGRSTGYSSQSMREQKVNHAQHY